MQTGDLHSYSHPHAENNSNFAVLNAFVGLVSCFKIPWSWTVCLVLISCTKFFRNCVKWLPLFCCNSSAWNSETNQTITIIQFFCSSFSSSVSVVLHVHSVKFTNASSSGRTFRLWLSCFFLQRTSQSVAFHFMCSIGDNLSLIIFLDFNLTFNFWHPHPTSCFLDWLTSNKHPSKIFFISSSSKISIIALFYWNISLKWNGFIKVHSTSLDIGFLSAQVDIGSIFNPLVKFFSIF